MIMRIVQKGFGLLLAMGVLLGLAGNGFASDQGLNPRYLIHADVVYDKKTNLTWTRCNVGQKWKSGSGCTGTASILANDDVERLDQENRRAGKGWRIPTRAELETLVDQTNRPPVDTVAFPDIASAPVAFWAWSSLRNTFSCCLILYQGFIGSTDTYVVKLVKDGH